MRIAVNVKNTGQNKIAEKEDFVNECLKQIAFKHSEDEFIFISDKPFSNGVVYPKNSTTLIIGAETKKNILWQLWYNYKLPAALKKIKADVLINADGICSLRTQIPQCVFINDLSFLYYPELIQKNSLRFYKKFTLPSLHKAQTIVTTSSFLKKSIIDKYHIDETKISVSSFGINEIFQPISHKEKEGMKEKYSDGKEYFLYKGSLNNINNLINLLKAFSFFKKRQKSNMQLIIIANSVFTDDKFINNLKLYKYRNEVKLLEKISPGESAKIMAAAYAFIHVPLYNDFALSLPEAMKCGVPVIASDIASMHEILADAALYANPLNYEDIANQMMLLFKDENKRNELIENGMKRANEFDLDKTADVLWQAVIKSVQL